MTLQLFNRTHALIIRLELSAGGKAQAIGQSFSHAKPGSSIPDMTVLADQRQIEHPILSWIELHGPTAGSLVNRLHAAIVEASSRDRDHLQRACEETETRLRIEWKDEAHHAMPPVSLDELRTTRQRMLLHKGFGMGTLELARAEGITRDDVRHVRRSHGISGTDGTRKDKCPEAVLQLSPHDWCATCQVVDDRAREEKAEAA